MVPRAHQSHQPKRHLGRFSRFCMSPKRYAIQCIINGEENTQNCRFPCDFVTPAEEDRATATGNVRKNSLGSWNWSKLEYLGNTPIRVQGAWTDYLQTSWMRLSDWTWTACQRQVLHACGSSILSVVNTRTVADGCIVCNEHNTVFGWKVPEHKLFTSCIRRCLVSLAATEWCQCYLSCYFITYLLFPIQASFFHVGQPGSTAAYLVYSISDIGRCRKFG